MTTNRGKENGLRAVVVRGQTPDPIATLLKMLAFATVAGIRVPHTPSQTRHKHRWHARTGNTPLRGWNQCWRQKFWHIQNIFR